jgi:hypothetical protein
MLYMPSSGTSYSLISSIFRGTIPLHTRVVFGETGTIAFSLFTSEIKQTEDDIKSLYLCTKKKLTQESLLKQYF